MLSFFLLCLAGQFLITHWLSALHVLRIERRAGDAGKKDSWPGVQDAGLEMKKKICPTESSAEIRKTGQEWRRE